MLKGNCEFKATGGQYFITVILHLGLLSLLSLGLYLPWALVRLFKLKASHTTIQGKKTVFSGTGGQFFGLLLLTGFLTIITLGLYGPWGLCRILRWKADATLVDGVPSRFSGTGGTLFLLYLVHLILLPIITLGFYYLVGMYRFYAWKEERTFYGGKPTSFGASLGGYIKICILTSVLNSLTFALFTPWALCMLYRWQMGGLVVGDKDLVDHFPPVRTSWRAVVITFLMGLLLAASTGYLIFEEIQSHMDALSQGSFEKVTALKSKIVMEHSNKLPASKGTNSDHKAKRPDSSTIDQDLQKLDLFIQENPKNANAYYNRACLYEQKGTVDRALKDYTEAINIDSDLGDAYFNRGILRANMKQYHMAVQDFDRAIALNPALKDAYCNRGNAYYGLKKYHLAVQDYDKALEIEVKDGDVYFNRGLALLSLDETDRAMEDFKKALQLGQKKAESYLTQ